MSEKKPPKTPVKKRAAKTDHDQGARFKRFALEHGATDSEALDKAMGPIIDDATAKKSKKT